MTRADRPPGPDTRDGPAAQPARPHHARAPVQDPPATVDDGAGSSRALPHDQIDPARLVIGDATGRLDGQLGVLAVALAQWTARDDTRPQPEVRRAASTAVDAVDLMLRELHQLRARLMAEIRASDDATAARVDAPLARSPAVLGPGEDR